MCQLLELCECAGSAINRRQRGRDKRMNIKASLSIEWTDQTTRSLYITEPHSLHDARL